MRTMKEMTVLPVAISANDSKEKRILYHQFGAFYTLRFYSIKEAPAFEYPSSVDIYKMDKKVKA